MNDATGTTTYVYDALNRPTSVTFPGSRTVSYAYSDVGNRSTITYPGSDVVTYAYDVANNLTSVTDWNNNQTTYTYDDAGLVATINLPKGYTGSYGYDDADRLNLIEWDDAGGAPVVSTGYYLDAVGNRTAKVSHLPADYRQAVLDDSPTGYWRLGETGGTTADDISGNSKDGTYTGSPPLGAAGAILGDADTAVTIAAGDNVNMGDEFDFDGTAPFSFEAWIYPATIDTIFRRIVSKADPDDPAGRQGWLLWLRDLGTGYHQLGFDRFRDGTNNGVLASTVVLELNEYSHVAATFDGNNVKIYLNGAEVGTANYGSPNSLKDTSDDFKLGDSSAGGANFLGRIDEAAVYDFALSADTVSQRYYDGQPGYKGVVMSDSPVGYWRLGEPSGMAANDESPFDRDGTYTSSPPLGVGGAILGDSDTAVTIASGDNVEMGDEFDFAGTVPFSFEAWIYPTTIDTIFRRIVSKADPDDPAGRQGWLLWLRDLGTGYHQLGFERFRDGTNQGVLASTVVLELNEYSHVAATFNGNNMKIYLNGLEVGTANYGSPNSLKDTSDAFKLGDSSAGGANFLGRIDEAAVYDFALSPAAVSRHYADSVYSYDDLYRLTKSTYADQSSDTFTYDAVGNRQAVLDDGPVGYWRLGEASGTNANDETANNKDGTYNGSPPLGAAGAVGDGDTAVTIAVGDNVNMGDEFDFANTVSFTFEAWIYPTTIDTTYHRIVSKKDPNDPNGSQGWVIWLHDLAPGYQLGFQRYLDCANQAVLVSNVEIELNEWSHLMATFDGTDMKLYLNGVLIKTQTYGSALSMTGNTEDFKLGESANGGSNFIGRIDEAAVYSSALGATVAGQRYRDGLRSDVIATYEYEVFGEVSASTGTLDNFFEFTGEQSDSSTGLQYLRRATTTQPRGGLLAAIHSQGLFVHQALSTATRTY